MSLAAATLVDYYSLRFQIEFNFRDGKQHFGLGDFQATDSVAIANSVGVSMLCLLVSEHLLVDLRSEYPNAGIQDLKSSYRGAYYVRATLKYLPFSVSAIILSGLEKRIRRLGCLHLLSKSSSRSDLCSESGWEEAEEALLLAA